ncbi:hypothetical protein [Mesorhizobium sp. SARCC-RB16n]|uniref:hypothetical protein n=1 Tax=Mesorhizobium sp. SARCC-RB16n TaxID=2116687 RepID=UPI0027B98024|nr:hypothetical protein [Mesorhizobium sp. SARCC-RB16n]
MAKRDIGEMPDLQGQGIVDAVFEMTAFDRLPPAAPIIVMPEREIGIDSGPRVPPIR